MALQSQLAQARKVVAEFSHFPPRTLAEHREYAGALRMVTDADNEAFDGARDRDSESAA